MISNFDRLDLAPEDSGWRHAPRLQIQSPLPAWGWHAGVGDGARLKWDDIERWADLAQRMGAMDQFGKGRTQPTHF